MIDENLRRKECTAAELSYQTARRKVLYELKFEETKHGGDRGNQFTGGKVASRNDCDLPERFTLNTAKATGKSERHIKPFRQESPSSMRQSLAPQSQECDRPRARVMRPLRPKTIGIRFDARGKYSESGQVLGQWRSSAPANSADPDWIRDD